MDPAILAYLDPALLVNIPLRPPPDGVVSNFDNPETLKATVEIAFVFLMVIGAIFLVLRLYTKIFITKLYGWDDVLCILGYMNIASYSIVTLSIMGSGEGKIIGTHEWNTRFIDITKSAIQRTLATLCLYSIAALSIKVSIFILYLRLFQVKTGTRWVIYIGMVACVVVYVGILIAFCVLLIPLPGQPQTTASWQARGALKRDTAFKISIAQAVFGTLSDIYLFLIPIQSVMALSLPLGRRIVVSMVFVTGLIAVACSIGSMVVRIQATGSNDFQWNSTNVYILSSSEVTAGIICASTPVCKPLFRGDRQLLPSSFKRYFSRSQPSQMLEKAHSGGTSNPSDQSGGAKTQQQNRRDINTESVDSLFRTNPGSEWESLRESVELQSVVVK